MPRTLSQRQKLLYAAAAICKPCCGSGSGSGSGGGAQECCGCTTFPENLTVSFTVPCLGSDTVTLSINEAFNDPCNNDPETLLKLVYGYSMLGNPVEEMYYTDCVSGVPVAVFGGWDEVISIAVICTICPDRWALQFQWDKYDAIDGFRQVRFNGIIELVSCSPLTFQTIESEVVCVNNRTTDVRCEPTNAGLGLFYFEPWTPVDGCVGGTLEVNISE